MERPRIGGFQDQARLGLFFLPLGALWPVVPVLGCRGQPLLFPWPIPDPGIFSIPLVLSVVPKLRKASTSRRIPLLLIGGNICDSLAAL
jgi:hypothetical protein